MLQRKSSNPSISNIQNIKRNDIKYRYIYHGQYITEFKKANFENKEPLKTKTTKSDTVDERNPAPVDR